MSIFLYIYIVIFSIICGRLFYENINGKLYQLICKKSSNVFELKMVKFMCFLKAFFKAIIPSAFLLFIGWGIYEFFLMLYNFFNNQTEFLDNSKITHIKEFVLDGYGKATNLPVDSFYVSLLLATLFAIYAIVSFVFFLIINLFKDSIKEMPSMEELEKEKFSLNKDIGKIGMPTEYTLDTFPLKKVFIYKLFIFCENVKHLFIVAILWEIQYIQTLNYYILILSILIISYTTTLRILGEYLSTIIDKLSFIHKLQIYATSTLIPLVTIILGYMYMKTEHETMYLYTLVIFTIISFITLYYGESILNKIRKIIAKEIKDEKEFQEFIKVFSPFRN